MWYACSLNKLAHFHSSIKISMISGVATSIEHPERDASHVDVLPRLNSFTQLYTVTNADADVCYEHPIRLWFLSALNLSYVDVWSLHETRFFPFCKKYKGCSSTEMKPCDEIPLKIWQ